MTPEEFAAARRDMTETLIDALTELYDQLGAWRDLEQALFLSGAVPLVRGAQRVIADMTAAHIADQAAAAYRRPIAPPTVADDDAVDVRYDVTTDEVYARTFSQVHAALARGRSLDDAVSLGRTRLTEIAELDMQQTHSRAVRAATASLPRGITPTGRRRVLIGAENCALCVIASTQRYSVDTLRPIHPGCDCDEEILFDRGRDPVIEPERLEQVHTAVAELTGRTDRGARAPDYRQITVACVREHGELGPMLARPRDRFDRGPGRGTAPARTPSVK